MVESTISFIVIIDNFYNTTPNINFYPYLTKINESFILGTSHWRSTSTFCAMDDDFLYRRRSLGLDLGGIVIVAHHFRKKIDVPGKRKKNVDRSQLRTNLIIASYSPNGKPERIHFTESLLVWQRGYVLSESFEGVVDGLHSLPLAHVGCVSLVEDNGRRRRRKCRRRSCCCVGLSFPSVVIRGGGTVLLQHVASWRGINLHSWY